jgi:NAD(P)-dependent dehydrogenase (short-subunit alcohol dehydrogenase family)
MPKSIVITGGGRGIGAATALLAGKRGWSVAINYLGNEAAANETAAAVNAAGGKTITVRGDVAVEDDVVAMFDAAFKAFGQVDGVVNNAGIIVPPPQPLADMSLDRLKRVVAVNFVGAYLVAREAVRRMAKSRGGNGGVIVNLSSAAARLGAPNEFIDYAGSKGAIDTLTVGLAKEVGNDGIRVNAVRPGLIETEIHASGGEPGRAARLGATVPLGRSGTAEETAQGNHLAPFRRIILRQRRLARRRRRPLAGCEGGGCLRHRPMTGYAPRRGRAAPADS